MNEHAYKRVVSSAHAVRIMARSVASDGLLDEAIDAISRADAVGPMLDPTLYRDRREAMAQDEATLRAVRMLASLGDEDLAGAAAAPEPAQDLDPRSAGSPDQSAPAPAKNISTGEGVASEAGSGTGPANASLRGSPAPSPAETSTGHGSGRWT